MTHVEPSFVLYALLLESSYCTQYELYSIWSMAPEESLASRMYSGPPTQWVQVVNVGSQRDAHGPLAVALHSLDTKPRHGSLTPPRPLPCVLEAP